MANAQKQIDANDLTIKKLQMKLSKLQKQTQNQGTVDWELRLREQQEIQHRLEKEIRTLEKTNQRQGQLI